MALRDLVDLGLILPREHWGHAPSASRRTGILTALASFLGLGSALLIWYGEGSAMMARLKEIGADGPTVTPSD